MRSLQILEGNYYHVYNRGNSKQTLFHDKADYARFLFLLLHQQSPTSLPQTNRFVKNYLNKGNFSVNHKDLNSIIDGRLIELVNFCVMPNHFHLTVKTVSDDGLSKYMHKLGNAYSQYFNKRYEMSGHVFQGTYKAKLVDTDQQLAYLSAYIHRNPNEITQWKNNAAHYPWSSYQDYQNNRWGELLVGDMVTSTFKSFEDYSEFVESSGSKDDFEV
jgi:putative transposase